MPQNRDNNGPGIVSHQQHGIGELIQEFNNEYQRKYNTTEVVFNEGATDLTVEVENTNVDFVATLYGSAMTNLVGSVSYDAGGYPPAVQTLSNVVGSLSGRGSQIERVTNADIEASEKIAIDPSDGSIWAGSSSGSLEKYDRFGNKLIDNSDLLLPTNLDLNSHAFDFSDGTLWGMDRFDDLVHHVDRQGNAITEAAFAAPGIDCRDLTVDQRDGTLWIVDEDGGAVYHMDRAGNTITSFAATSPTHASNAEGIDWDFRDGNLWLSSTHFDTPEVWKVDTAGAATGPSFSIASEFQSICTDPVDGSIWGVKVNNDSFYRLSPYAQVDVTDYSGHTWIARRRP